MSNVLIATLIVLAIAVAIAWFKVYPRPLRATPPQLKKGSPLPEFNAVDEQGEPLRSTDLEGAPAVITDAAGVIRYVEVSRQISDRPDPRKLLREIRKALRS